MIAQNLPPIDVVVDSSGTEANFKNLRMRQNKGSSKAKNNKLKGNSLTKKSTLVVLTDRDFKQSATLRKGSS